MAVVLAGLLLVSSISAPSAGSLEPGEPSSSADDGSSGLQALPPTDSRTWPIGGALGARLYCIEWYESRHFGGARNPYSGARGWLQWLPATARAWGVIIGDRTSEWQAAARIAAHGERFFASQWVPIQGGLC